MRFQAIFAILLAAILLACSCVASACGTRCDLASLHHACHGSSQATGMAGMQPMDTLNHLDYLDHCIAGAQAASTCQHQAGAIQPIFLPQEKQLPLQPSVAVTVGVIGTYGGAATRVLQAAQPQLSLAVPLRTILRV